MECGLYLMEFAPCPYDTSEPHLSLDEWGEMSQGWEHSRGRNGRLAKIFRLNIGQRM